MAAEKRPAPLTGIQQHALDWCRARESFLHVEFRRAAITGPTIYSLIKRGLVQFDSTTCLYRALGVQADDGPRCPSCNKPRREPGLCYRCTHGVSASGPHPLPAQANDGGEHHGS